MPRKSPKRAETSCCIASYRQLYRLTSTPPHDQNPRLPKPRQCRLVSVLDHKYTDTGLSFALLKGRDRVVAQALGTFCEESQGRFSLFLSRVKYTHNTDGIDDDEDDFSVQLLSPWVPYGGASSLKVSDVYVEVMSEVAPAGMFAHVSFDGEEYPDAEYMGNEGSRVEQWYKTAALIVQPHTVMTKLQRSMR